MAATDPLKVRPADDLPDEGEELGDGEHVHLARLAHLRAELASLGEPNRAGVPADRAVEWMRTLAETWEQADVPEAKAELLHAIYEVIVVAGRRIVSARLTPSAYEHGLALAMPEVVMASPAGFEPATLRLEGACSVH